MWLFQKSGLKIYHLQEDAYQQQPVSRYFPTVDLPALIAEVLQVAAAQGTGVVLRQLRQRLMTS